MKDRQEYFAVIQDLAQTIQAATIYPENHRRIQQLFARLQKRIGQMTSSIGTLHIGIIGDHFVVDEFPFLEMNPALRKLLGEIHEKGIEKISIRDGLTYGEMKRFIYFLATGKDSAQGTRFESIDYGRIQSLQA